MVDFWIQARIVFSFCMAWLALGWMGVELGRLHLRADPQMREQIDSRRTAQHRIQASRGQILDSRGRENVLALNALAWDVCINPTLLRTNGAAERVCGALADPLGMSAEDIRGKIALGKGQFACLKRFVPYEATEAIRAQELPGVFFEEQNSRYYPLNDFMCHVLGFVRYDAAGAAGIELAMDEYLRGCPGFLRARVNAQRKEIPLQRGEFVPAETGADVVLTLDQNVQYIVEQALHETMREHNARGAWAIVQRIRTGEILAMASLPSYDLNQFPRADDNERLNRAIGMVFEPGSTFKAITFAAALNEGLTSPKEVIDCENGTWYHAGRPLRDFHPYGRLTVEDGIKKSSNIMTAKLAVRLGEKRLHRYLQDFGVGRRTQIDLPGEEVGLLSPVSQWWAISITRIPMGQGVAVTALQLLGVYSAIANDGCLMRPYVVREVRGRDGTVLLENRPQVVGQPIRPEVADKMRRMLARVTEDGGTGRRARVEGYSVAGKTGTAQKAVNGGYSSSAHTASFVGFLPAESPEVAMVVVVDEPQPEHQGGRVAAPAFGRIAEQVVRYLEIVPSGGLYASK